MTHGSRSRGIPGNTEVLRTLCLVGMASHLNSDMSSFEWAITGRPDTVFGHSGDWPTYELVS